VGVQQTPHRADDALALADVRAVGVALLVGVRMVLAVVGHPVDDRALHGHRARDGEQVLDGLGRAERAMGEHAVEADRDAEGREQVQHDHHGQIVDPDDVVPEHHDGGEDHERRQDHREQVGDAGGFRHVLEPMRQVDDLVAASPRPTALNL
jgi:hypothetical protein